MSKIFLRGLTGGAFSTAIEKNNPIYPYETGETCQILEPGTSGSFRIIHYTKHEALQNILTEGLKTRDLLASEGCCERSTNGLADQNTSIYFRAPFKNGTDLKSSGYSLDASPWIAIDVDPNKTFVFNSELRIKRNQGYQYQRITLKKWLQLREAYSSIERNPQELILTNPYSGEPRICHYKSPLVSNSEFAGSWEIICHNQIIRPEFFADTSVAYKARVKNENLYGYESQQGFRQ